ncbi:MAG: hypothetical protein ACHQJ6_07180 [Candidatus Berkiellales bacterium]
MLSSAPLQAALAKFIQRIRAEKDHLPPDQDPAAYFLGIAHAQGLQDLTREKVQNILEETDHDEAQAEADHHAHPSNSLLRNMALALTSVYINPKLFAATATRKVLCDIFPELNGKKGAILKLARDISVIGLPLLIDAYAPAYSPLKMFSYYQKCLDEYGPIVYGAAPALVFLYQNRPDGRTFMQAADQFVHALHACPDEDEAPSLSL